MTRERCTFRDPTLQQTGLVGRQWILLLRRWHEFVCVRACDARHQLTLLQFAGDDRRITSQVGEGAFLRIDTELRRPFL